MVFAGRCRGVIPGINAECTTSQSIYSLSISPKLEKYKYSFSTDTHPPHDQKKEFMGVTKDLKLLAGQSSVVLARAGDNDGFGLRQQLTSPRPEKESISVGHQPGPGKLDLRLPLCNHLRVRQLDQHIGLHIHWSA